MKGGILKKKRERGRGLMWKRYMAFVTGHLSLCWIGCAVCLAAIGCLEIWDAPLWLMELLTLPLNLVSWPAAVTYWQGARKMARQGKATPRMVDRLALAPAVITTLAALHLMASIG